MVKMQTCAAGLTLEPLTTGPAIVYKHINRYYSCTVSIIQDWHSKNYNVLFIILNTDEYFWKQKVRKFF
jgi:hypothetical protein